MDFYEACPGEFGLVTRFHVPWVHAMSGPKEVEVEAGNEALYPSADRHVVVARGDDDRRRGMPGWRPPPGGLYVVPGRPREGLQLHHPGRRLAHPGVHPAIRSELRGMSAATMATRPNPPQPAATPGTGGGQP